MNTNTQITTGMLIVAAAGGLATAGSLELDRAYASDLRADADTRSVLNESNLSNLDVSVGIRFNYAFNSRDGAALGDNDTTIGFGFTEAQVAIEGDVTENMHARISFDFGVNDSDPFVGQGTAVLEDAFVDWAVNDSFSLRVGQFVPAYSAEASTSEFNMMNAYRSATHEILATPAWTQGVEARFGGDTWGLVVGFNDGPATPSLAFNSGLEFDYSFNARIDFFGDSNKARFEDQTSWRGSENGWRVGAGFMYTAFGDTNPSSTDDSDTIWYTVDGAFEGDGWAVRAAFYGASRSFDNGGNRDYDNYGFEIGASVFMSDQWEAFVRWDTLILDDGVAGGPQVAAGGDDVQNFIALGANYYFVPESHAAKFTLEVGVALDETNDIIASNSNTGSVGSGVGSFIGNSGFLKDAAGENGQLMISGTMQWLF